MCFTFAWAGWEGAAHDSRIFGEALRRKELNFSHPLGNKYYLVDAGYAHRRDIWLHTKETINIVERTFGVWKARWSILRDMPYYNIDTQRDIVLATMAIHNYIKQKCNVDDAFQTAEDERYIPLVDSEFGSSSNTNNEENNMEEQNDTYWTGLRDMIANEIGNA
uniref:DDE Tnp4 domain-containing protein n=1 Tax=Solanum lycopersicum TaxID=4081 RepID=A0A3Q7G4M7_SOLLC